MLVLRTRALARETERMKAKRHCESKLDLTSVVPERRFRSFAVGLTNSTCLKSVMISLTLGGLGGGSAARGVGQQLAPRFRAKQLQQCNGALRAHVIGIREVARITES